MKGIELAAGGLLTYLRANLNAEIELINGENDDFDLVAVDEQAFRDYEVLPDKFPTLWVLGNRGDPPVAMGLSRDCDWLISVSILDQSIGGDADVLRHGLYRYADAIVRTVDKGNKAGSLTVIQPASPWQAFTVSYSKDEDNLWEGIAEVTYRIGGA